MYVGRIVIVGMMDRPFAGYRVSSRSFPNRIARETAAGVAIEPLDPADLARNPYIAYNCLRSFPDGVVVSNGSHTDPIFEALEEGTAPEDALARVLEKMGYERDEHNTPRLAGVVAGEIGYLGIVRADGLETASFALTPGCCRVICTYEMDHVTDTSLSARAATADEAARFVIEGEFFRDLRPSGLRRRLARRVRCL